ncbi:MAG: hypothetical protein AMXMBFR4_05580 [Candidatus Hydrogenedentota bacterium]
MKFRISYVAALACVAACATPVCAQAPDLRLMDLVLKAVPDGPVAQVNNVPISAQSFKDLYMGEVLRWAQLNPGENVGDDIRLGIALNCLRALVEQEVLYQEAQRRKLTVSTAEFQERWAKEMDGYRRVTSKEGESNLSEEEVLKRANATREEAQAELRRALLIEKMRDQIIAEAGVKVTDQEVNEWYAQNRSVTRRPDMIHLKQIYVQADKSRRDKKNEQAQQKIQDAYNRIRAGQSFEGVAKAVSEGKHKDNGGDWGMQPASIFPPFIIEAANKLKPGEISAPIESEYGYHILKLVEIVPGEEVSIDKVRDNIRNMLLHKKGGQAVNEFCSKVTSDAQAVRVYLDLEKELALRPGLMEKLASEAAEIQGGPGSQAPGNRTP